MTKDTPVFAFNKDSEEQCYLWNLAENIFRDIQGPAVVFVNKDVYDWVQKELRRDEKKHEAVTGKKEKCKYYITPFGDLDVRCL